MQAWWKAGLGLCALGTTLRQAKSKAGFYRVDHDYVLTAAKLAQHAETLTFGFVSSLPLLHALSWAGPIGTGTAVGAVNQRRAAFEGRLRDLQTGEVITDPVAFTLRPF